MHRAPALRRQGLHCAGALLLLCLAWPDVGVTPARGFDSIVIESGGATAVDADAQRLASYRLIVPVVGVAKRSLIDTYNQRREGHAHKALDIPAVRGTQVVAAGEGRVVKLFRGAAGGLTVYQFDPSEWFAYYYAHLDQYAPG